MCLNENRGNHKYAMTADEPYADGLHERNINKTDVKFFGEGRTDYVLLVPEKRGEHLNFAIEEFTGFFRKATGYELSVKTDAEDYGNRYISLYSTREEQKRKIDKRFLSRTNDGYGILTLDSNIFVYASSERGILNGVYDLLGELINLKIFSADCIVYDRKPQKIFLPDFAVKEIPDFEYRMANYGIAKESGSKVVARRLRINLEDETWIPVGSYYHDSFIFLPPEKYYKDHPDWYCFKGKSDESQFSKGGQLCYSNEEMRLELTAQIEKYIERYPDLCNITVTQEDNLDWCDCAKCRASREKYGTDSAVVIKCLNKIRDDIDAWMKEKGLRRRVELVFFAYISTIDAPVYEKNGKYYPIDDDMRLKEGVSVFYAPIEAYYEKDFYDDLNRRFYDNMIKWSAISKGMYLWIYSANFYHYLAPFDTIYSMRGIYSLAKKCGVKYIYDQAQYNNLNGTDFYHLKLYLNSRLQWNVNEDIEKLTDEFFENYFDKAAPVIKKYFYEVKEQMKYIEETYKHFRVYTVMEKPNYYPQQILDKWLDYFKTAEKSVEYLRQVDEERYKVVTDRIILESISARYLKIMIYKKGDFNGDLDKFKEEFKRDVLRLGITRVRESKKFDVEYFIKHWILNTPDEDGNII